MSTCGTKRKICGGFRSTSSMSLFLIRRSCSFQKQRRPDGELMVQAFRRNGHKVARASGTRQPRALTKHTPRYTRTSRFHPADSFISGYDTPTGPARMNLLRLGLHKTRERFSGMSLDQKTLSIRTTKSACIGNGRSPGTMRPRHLKKDPRMYRWTSRSRPRRVDTLTAGC